MEATSSATSCLLLFCIFKIVSCDYSVIFQTNQTGYCDFADYAGTDAKLTITLHGSTGSITKVVDSNTGVVGFEVGNVDTVEFANDVGEISNISILNDNTGFSPDWIIHKISVVDGIRGNKSIVPSSCVPGGAAAVSFSFPAFPTTTPTQTTTTQEPTTAQEDNTILIKERRQGEMSGGVNMIVGGNVCYSMRGGFILELSLQDSFSGAKLVSLTGQHLHCGSVSQIGVLSLRLLEQFEKPGRQQMNLCTFPAREDKKVAEYFCEFECRCRTGFCQSFVLIIPQIHDIVTNSQICSVTVSD